MNTKVEINTEIFLDLAQKSSLCPELFVVRPSFPLLYLHPIFVWRAPCHLLEQSAQVVRILESHFVGDFADGLVGFQQAVFYISNADVLIVGGTSLTVYPAAGLIDYYRGNKLILINKSVTSMDSRADLVISGPIGEILGDAVGI